MPLAYVSWRAGTTYRDVVPVRQDGNRFLGSLKGLQIRALAGRYDNPIPSRCLAPIEFSKIPARGSLNLYKYGLRLHWLAELVTWNRFLGSIT
jgi:hypothetical protein